MNTADNMVRRELQSQRQQFGLEHDIENHGSLGLAEVAGLLASRDPPDLNSYDEDQWFCLLWKKHEKDPARRYAIAAAMLHNAIECLIYESGQPRN